MRAPPRDRWTLGRLVVTGAFAIGIAVLVIANPPAALLSTGFGAARGGMPHVAMVPGAFGESGQVRLQVRMPGEHFDFPIEITGAAAPGSYAYTWVKAEDSSAVVEPRPLAGTTVTAPPFPGFYRFALIVAGGRRVVDSVLVGVLVPFSTKLGATLNGYRMGRYRWERVGGNATPPPVGFLEVTPDDARLQASAHLRLGAFFTHGGPDVWPRYVALDPRILDKIELVLTDLDVKDFEMPMDVNSGFRTPLYNSTVPRAASDSRHEYGDAADLAIDVDGDGKVTYADAVAVARAVERVEERHPDLVGGLGLYGNHGTSPYVHIDVRGKPSRWKE